MEEKIQIIREWLGTGSINIFGLPFSGKDTIGVQLAQLLNGKFLSSGLILRASEEADKKLTQEMSKGLLADTNKFINIVMPYLHRSDLRDFSLVLSSVGRWEGEEDVVMQNAEDSGHPIKAVILLNISEAEVKKRWETSKTLEDRGQREDDRMEKVIDTRIEEFETKTMPVIETYRNLGLLVSVHGMSPREKVFEDTINQLYQFALDNGHNVVIEAE